MESLCSLENLQAGNFHESCNLHEICRHFLKENISCVTVYELCPCQTQKKHITEMINDTKKCNSEYLHTIFVRAIKMVYCCQGFVRNWKCFG